MSFWSMPGSYFGPGGPERGPAEQDECGGQEGDGGEEGRGDADRRDRAETAIGVQIRQQQAQHAEDDGARRRGDRLDRASERTPHGRVLVLLHPQFFAVAGYEQQRVVRRGAEHQDEHDALALPVERDDVGVGELVHHQAREGECEHRRDDDDERQDGTAVDHHEDDEDDAAGDEQQQTVDAPEGRRQVGGLAGRSRHVDGQPLRGVLQCRTQFLDGVPYLPGGIDRDDHLHRAAVLGRDRWRTGRFGRDELDVFGGDRTVAFGHHDRRDELAAVELRIELVGPGGLGGGREERTGVGGRDFAELAGERPASACGYEPRDEEEGGEQPPPATGLSRWCGCSAQDSSWRERISEY